MVLVRQVLGVLLQLLDGVVFVDVPVRLDLQPGMSQSMPAAVKTPSSSARAVVGEELLNVHQRDNVGDAEFEPALETAMLAAAAYRGFAVAGKLLVPAVRARHMRRLARLLA